MRMLDLAVKTKHGRMIVDSKAVLHAQIILTNGYQSSDIESCGYVDPGGVYRSTYKINA